VDFWVYSSYLKKKGGEGKVPASPKRHQLQEGGKKLLLPRGTREKGERQLFLLRRSKKRCGKSFPDKGDPRMLEINIAGTRSGASTEFKDAFARLGGEASDMAHASKVAVYEETRREKLNHSGRERAAIRQRREKGIPPYLLSEHKSIPEKLGGVGKKKGRARHYYPMTSQDDRRGRKGGSGVREVSFFVWKKAGKGMQILKGEMLQPKRKSSAPKDNLVREGRAGGRTCSKKGGLTRSSREVFEGGKKGLQRLQEVACPGCRKKKGADGGKFRGVEKKGHSEEGEKRER